MRIYYINENIIYHINENILYQWGYIVSMRIQCINEDALYQWGYIISMRIHCINEDTLYQWGCIISMRIHYINEDTLYRWVASNTLYECITFKYNIPMSIDYQWLRNKHIILKFTIIYENIIISVLSINE
jgi:hypothetical protein